GGGGGRAGRTRGVVGRRPGQAVSSVAQVVLPAPSPPTRASTRPPVTSPLPSTGAGNPTAPARRAAIALGVAPRAGGRANGRSPIVSARVSTQMRQRQAPDRTA